MGGAVSSGRNNDDLIDNLLEADYIKSSLIERVFRAVDRAEYFLPEARSSAYKDLAWKSGNLHLSAPCIYSEVMEGLCLETGLSFLNLGSGTGYLSTMVGLVLGINGLNHGIEIHDDVIQYANKKLEEFKKYSGAIDEYDFCEPKFVQGNCLCLTSDCTKLYDRIYCGAACPEDYETYMKNLLKVGGILVMPINESLLQIKRVSEMEWTNRTLLPVSFASLVPPHEDKQEWVGPIEVEPLSLQVLCRGVVRRILRKIIEKEHLPVPKPPPVKAPKKKRALRRLVIPLFESDDSSEEERHHVRLGGERNRDAGRATFIREDDYILSLFLGIGGRQGAGDRGDRPGTATAQNQKTATSEEPMETDSSVEDSSDTRNKDFANSQEVHAVIEHHSDSNDNENAVDEPSRGPSLETFNEIGDVISECLNVLRRERGSSVENHEDILSEDEDNVSDHKDNVATQSNAQDNWPTTSRGKKNNKREKFDSGLGDEIIETQDSSDDEHTKLDTISSCDEDHAEKRNKRGTSSSDNEDDTRQSNVMHMYKSPYTERMAIKIQQLPLPPILKKYLNFLRDL